MPDLMPILFTIADRFQIDPIEIRSSARSREIVAARRAAITALSSKGLSIRRIALFLKIDRTTVEYHLGNRRRAARIAHVLQSRSITEERP